MKKITNPKTGFSLMEMMVVLLIISIVAAVSAPMVSKKLARNAEQSDNPWVYPNLGNNIAYNMGGDDNRTAIIGAVSVPTNANNNPRLYINGAGGIAFGDGGTYTGSISLPSEGNIMIGSGTSDNGKDKITIGSGASSKNDNSIAIGTGAKAEYSNSVAIGAGAATTTNNQIVLGTASDTASDTVYIPGNLVVGGTTYLTGYTYVYAPGVSYNHDKTSDKTGDLYLIENSFNESLDLNGNSFTDLARGSTYFSYSSSHGVEKAKVSLLSDRRLKNVGEKFTGGLEELKKLDLYHFTFKKDEKKTPHVGVMAQDLQKVFPNAVTEGEDGYLRIRWDEMFYAVINAVKELDTKITAAVEQVKTYTDKVNKLEETISTQQQTIEEQQKAINELKKNNAEFEKRLAKLEKTVK